MNTEFYKLLGQRIKERRKELGLTQNAVCGDYITRNMLSSIENGSAKPSLDTLIYISDKLNIPSEYFMSRDSKTAALYKRIETIDNIRTLFESRQYNKCLELCYSMNIDDSEICLIAAESELKLSIECLSNSKLISAEEHMVKCEIFADKCIYNSERIKATVLFLRRLIDCVRENRYPDMSVFNEKRAILVDEEFIIFVYTLALSKDKNDILKTSVDAVTNPIYKSYLTAEHYIAGSEFELAKQYLHNIITSNPGFFTKYFTIRNLELCYKETDDYKSAYDFAKKRLELIDKFND